jgi:outer membrane murein-binding lipoprotein Lpp
MPNHVAARVYAVGALILGASWLAGCASLSEAECLSGDWRVIGFQDGTAGEPPGRVGQHSEACARYGVAPNLDLWRIGYEEGLVRYCTRPNGFSAGVQGSTYYGVCSGPAADEFLIAYRDGQQVFNVRQALVRADTDFDSISSEIDRVRYDRDQARVDADADGISRQDRQAYLDKAERLSEELGELRREREDIDYSRQRIQNDMWGIEAQMRSYYPEWNGY